MAESQFSAWVEVLPDFSNFRKNATSEMSSVLGSAGTTGGLLAGQNMSGGLLNGIRGLAAPILGAIAALGIGRLVGEAIGTGIRFGLEAVDFASALEEQKNAVGVAFGDIGDEILKLGENAPKALNLTQTAFAQLAVRFSSFAKTIAGSGGNVAGVIANLTQRGADFASVYDIEASQALELFQSGLAGETEPLRKFGLDLSAAAVAQYALNSGINDGTHELTEAEKIQARYGLLLEQTAQVQGDLANTAGSYSNQQREFAVALEEAQTKFGSALLPVATSFLSLANDTLLPRLGEALEKIGPELGAKLAEAAPAIADLAVNLADALPDLATMATDSLPGIIDGFQQIADAAPEWVAAFQTVDTAVVDMDTEFKNLQDDIIATRQTVIESIAGWIVAVNEQAAPFNEAVNDFFTDPKAVLLSMVGIWGQAGEDAARGFASGIDRGKAGALVAAKNLADEVVGTVRSALQIASPSRVMETLGGFTAEGFALGIAGGSSDVSSAISSMLDLPSTAGASLSLASSSSADGSSGFPSQITLVDADGSLLGLMDVRISDQQYVNDTSVIGGVAR